MHIICPLDFCVWSYDFSTTRGWGSKDDVFACLLSFLLSHCPSSLESITIHPQYLDFVSAYTLLFVACPGGGLWRDVFSSAKQSLNRGWGAKLMKTTLEETKSLIILENKD